MSEDGTRFGIICLGEATKQEAGGVNREDVSRCVKGECVAADGIEER